MSIQDGSPGSTSAKPAVKKATPIALHSSTRWKPSHLRVNVEIGRMEIAPIARAKVMEPDWNGLIPTPTCSMSGSRKGTPLMPMREMPPTRGSDPESPKPEQGQVERRRGMAPGMADEPGDEQQRDGEDAGDH